MSHDEKQHDMASWAAHALESLLRFEGDPREINEHFEILSSVSEEIRRKWMAEYGVPYAAYEAWEIVQKAKVGE